MSSSISKNLFFLLICCLRRSFLSPSYLYSSRNSDPGSQTSPPPLPTHATVRFVPCIFIAKILQPVLSLLDSRRTAPTHAIVVALWTVVGARFIAENSRCAATRNPDLNLSTCSLRG